MSKYIQARKQAWEYYKTWMKEKTISNALNSEVRITRQGWNHILDRKTRDKINRFRLLKVAKIVIKNCSTYKLNREKGIEYVVIEDKVLLNGRQTKVKVILKKDRKGNYIFFSVMKK